MDKRLANRQTEGIMLRHARLSATLRLGPLLALLLGGAAVGCDRGGATGAKGAEGAKGAAALSPGAAEVSDPQWKADSTFIAGGPGVLFRVVRTPTLTQAVPLLRLGAGYRWPRSSWKRRSSGRARSGRSASTMPITSPNRT